MDFGVQFKIIWDNPDSIEVRVSVWNGAFGGTADIYVGHGELEDAAAKLSGFPENVKDSREIPLGSFEPNFVRGVPSFSLY